jgi:hypothetical protein
MTSPSDCWNLVFSEIQSSERFEADAWQFFDFVCWEIKDLKLWKKGFRAELLERWNLIFANVERNEVWELEENLGVGDGVGGDVEVLNLGEFEDWREDSFELFFC